MASEARRGEGGTVDGGLRAPSVRRRKDGPSGHPGHLEAISATGYAGSQSNLWAVIAGDAAKISQKEFDPEGFKELVTFRRAVVAKFSSLQRPFEEPRSRPLPRRISGRCSGSGATLVEPGVVGRLPGHFQAPAVPTIQPLPSGRAGDFPSL